ncbi:MAG: carboxypeptidase regulatory-like domain-containing protein [Chloroflexi bacterium]|nr:carboxypeptidase regulatory-like domain-containing protein [Chloroflexota bacterium]
MPRKATLVLLALLLALEVWPGIKASPVLATPAIAISPTTGPPDTVVTVSGTGFASGEASIIVTYGGSPVASGIAADAAGAWTKTFRVPRSATGPHVVGAYGTNTPAASAGTVIFDVTPAIAADPHNGLPGTMIKLMGDGFAANEAGIVVTYDGTEVESGISASSVGNWFIAFTIPALAAGAHILDAYGSVTAASAVPDVTITELPSGTISGHVYRGDPPVPFAWVDVWATGYDYGYGYSSARTGPDGSYSIRVPSGAYSVSAGALGFVKEYYPNTSSSSGAMPVRVTAPEDIAGIDFTLEPGGSISGHVYEADGTTPIPWANVAIDTPGSRTGPQVYTDQNGAYSISGLALGDYRIYAYDYRKSRIFEYFKDAYSLETATPVSVSAPIATTAIDFTLEQSGTISGHVYESDGATPITSFTVKANRVDGTGPVLPPAIPWPAPYYPGGAYSITGLAPGKYEVQVTGGGYITEYYKDVQYGKATPVEVAIGTTTASIDFTLEKGGSISGVAFAPGASGTYIAAKLVGGTYSASTKASDEDGTFTISGLPTGQYSVEAWNDNFNRLFYGQTTSRVAATLVSVTARDTTPEVELVLAAPQPTGKISGHIFAPDGVTPVSRGWVEVRDATTGRTAPAGWSYYSYTGAYTLSSLAPGSYLVRAGGTNWDGLKYCKEWYDDRTSMTDGTPVAVSAGQETTGIDFTLAVGGSISGHIYQPDGVTPVSDARVYVYDASGTNLHDQLGTYAGSYQTSALPDGDYKLRVTAYGYAAQWYGGAATPEETTTVTVVTPNVTADVNFVLAADGVAPEVTGVSPGDGATDIPADSAIAVTFSEPVESTEIGWNFNISPSVAGDFNQSGNSVTFTPTGGLSSGRLYTVTLTDAIRDLAGNPLGSSYRWSFATAPGLPEDVVVIPDPNLDAALRSSLAKPEGDIYKSDMAELVLLNTGSKGITNITGLDNATNLQVLSLPGNQIADLSPLAGLTSLRYLDLAGNRVDNITPIAGLTNLLYLGLANNQISDLYPITGLGKLEYLDLSNNDVASSSILAGLTNLRSLKLSDNVIGDLAPIGGLFNLRSLEIGNTSVIDLSPLAALAGLTHLGAVGNGITDIGALSGLKELRYLDLYRNQVSDIAPLILLKKLRVLSLAENQIVDVSPVEGMAELTELRLNDNQIVSIAPLVAKYGLSAGAIINLLNNPLDTDAYKHYIPALRQRGVNVICTERAVLTIAVQGSGTTNPPPGDYLYEPGTVVNLIATGTAPYQFASWTGEVADTALAATTVVMTQNKVVTARFVIGRPVLTIIVEGGGTTDPPPGTYQYDLNTVVTLSAVTTIPWQFNQWVGEVANAIAPVTTITLNYSKTVTARFMSSLPVLTIMVSGNGTTDPPPGYYAYELGTIVNLTATAMPPYQFANWTGAVADPASAVTTVTMGHSKTVTANFVPGPATSVRIDAPATVPEGIAFTATVAIGLIENFDAANYEVSFDPKVLRLDDVAAGRIGDKEIPVAIWSQVMGGRVFVVNNLPGLTGVTGSGYLAVLHFRVIGAPGTSSRLNLSNGALSNIGAEEIPAAWLGDSVEVVAVVPGDANGDGKLEATDITQLERIIARLAAAMPGADANRDGKVDALDITKTERLIAGLD